MGRGRRETIGPLGRMPARQSARPPLPASKAPTPPAARPPPPPSGVAGGGHDSGRGWLGRALLDNLGLKALSLVLALTVFLLINTDRDREITARVGVSYQFPDDRVLVSERIEEVRITVRGPWRRLRRFDEREIDRIDLDLTSAQDGQVAITPRMIDLPKGLTLTSISPRTIRVAFERRLDKKLEVAPILVGRPAHGFVVAEVVASPAAVTVRGADSAIGTLATMRTAEVRVDGRSESFTSTVALLPPEGVAVEPTTEVSIAVKIEEQLVTQRLGKVAVAVRGDVADPGRIVITPAEVSVVLTGAMRAVERAMADGVRPVVKVQPADAGRRTRATVTIEGLPPGIGVELVPTVVELSPRRAPPPPAPAPAP
ncbi:MAG: hypothetical protein KBG28_05450 [Kofleriaceae bacterium]|nr:hypothetical protein [Kofleriaceae bacterium]